MTIIIDRRALLTTGAFGLGGLVFAGWVACRSSAPWRTGIYARSGKR
jgi:hypothetical protein